MNAIDRRALATFVVFAFLFSATGCGGTADEPSATDKAIEGLQNKYDDLTEGGVEAPMEWASDDIKKIGDWQYKVIELGKVSGAELEAALNEAGSDRWEVIWMEKTLNGHSIVLKRPSISYLSKIPLSQLGRLVIGDSEASN